MDDVRVSRAYLGGLRQHLASHEHIGEIVTHVAQYREQAPLLAQPDGPEGHDLTIPLHPPGSKKAFRNTIQP